MVAQQKLKTFPDLRAEDFQHDWDRIATQKLKMVPGFDRLCGFVMEYGFERAYYLLNTAENVRISEKQFPRIYRSLQWACNILGVEEPEMYMTVDPVPNAFTYGQSRPFIVVTSGLLDIVDDRELFFVIGHELGHIKCEHVLYTMVANNISAILKVVGQMTLGLGALLGTGLELALFDWSRKAELSCDRAGLLCVQDRDVATQVFMKLAGGARGGSDQMNAHAFLEQFRAYEDADESKLNKTYKVLLTAFRSHPFPIMRAKHLDDWVEDGGFEKLTGIVSRPALNALKSGKEG